jgi:hypothetical protein
MTYFKSYTKNRVMPQKCWDDIFDLLASVNSDEVEDWLEERGQSGFTIEEFIYFLNSLDQDEIQDWLWEHREEFSAVLSRPSFNFDNSRMMDADNRWCKVLFLSPNKRSDAKE